MGNEKDEPYFRRVHNRVREEFSSKDIWHAFSALLTLLNSEDRLSKEQLILAKQDLKNSVGALNIDNIEDFDFMTLYLELKKVGYSIPAEEKSYPKVSEIYRNINDIKAQSDERKKTLRVEKEVLTESLTVSELARYAEIDFEKIGDLDNNRADFLHQLGLIVASRNAYEVLFPDEDAITVDGSCNVVNGIHRALFIVTNPDIVEKYGMDDYIKINVQREN